MPHRAPSAGATSNSNGVGNGGMRHARVQSTDGVPRVGYVAVKQGTAVTVNPPAAAAPLSNGNSSSNENSPVVPTRRSVRSVAFTTTSPGVPPAQPGDVELQLPPLQAGYEYQPVHFVTRDMDLPRVIDDPTVYRPATPILNWEGPRRSTKPPKLQFWISITLLCVVTNVMSGVIPLQLSDTDGQTFLAVWISVTAMLVATFAYMSTSRHLQNITMQMEGINSPGDIDVVLEKLQGGRFSRFEETWKVQVHMIKMFCRLLRDHHGVPALGSSGNVGASKPHRSASYGDDLFTPDGSVVYEGSEQEGDEDNAITDASLFSAQSTELPANGLAFREPGSFTKRSGHAMRRSASTSLTTFPEPSPVAGGPAGGSGSRRPRLTNADPLGDNSKDWDEVLTAGGDEGPPRSLFLQLLKQVKVGQDLSKIVLPVHILEPRSLLEKLSDLFIHPAMLGSVDEAADSVDRVRRLCRWFLSAYRMRPKGVKKPYNPVLGETFECYFARDTPDELWYLAEQVSHHPPITCFRAVHRRTKIEVVGSYVPRSKVVTPNTSASVGEGFFDVYIPRSGDSYRFTWPSAHVSGIISAPLRLELVGTVKITPRDGNCHAELNFEPKPYFSGEHDSVRGGIFVNNAKHPKYVIRGKWHSTTTIAERIDSVSMRKDSVNDLPAEVLFEPAEHQPVRPMAPPTTFPKPSRAVWKQVTVALRAGDAEAAQKAKAAIEQHEREVRRAREARGEDYVPGSFRIVGEVKGPGKDTWRYAPPSSESPGTIPLASQRRASLVSMNKSDTRLDLNPSASSN